MARHRLRRGASYPTPRRSQRDCAFLPRRLLEHVGLGAAYGAVYLVGYAAFRQGPSTGVGILLDLFGVFGTVRAVQTWRRTGLPLATTAMGVGAGSMIAAGSAVALGWDPRTDPVASVVFLISLSIARGRRVRAAAKWHPLRHPLQVVLQAAIDRQGRVALVGALLDDRGGGRRRPRLALPARLARRSAGRHLLPAHRAPPAGAVRLAPRGLVVRWRGGAT